MVIYMKTYQLYRYFKILEARSRNLSDKKRTRSAGWHYPIKALPGVRTLLKKKHPN